MKRRLMCLVVAIGAVAALHCNHYGSTGRDEVRAGFDAFSTDPAQTKFDFTDEFAVPAGFFDASSERFTGSVSFGGSPLGTYRGKATQADTIVERTQSAKLSDGYPATVPIRLAALSLKSVEPIRVQTGSGVQAWDVAVGLSPSRASEGTITIQGRGEKGSTFRSELVVYPLYTFTRQSDGAQRQLDVGRLQLPPNSIETLTLRTNDVPWTFGAGNAFTPLDRAIHQTPRHRHTVRPIEPLIFD